MQVLANGINIEVEDHGNPEDPAILLVMGYTAQLIYWPMDFVNGLVAEGFRVVRFDNRDVGLSYKFDGVRPPHPIRQMIAKRFFPKRRMAPYDLSDMAKDAIGVLDALKIDKAHIVGASMGGMIGQLIAADHADRVLSFTPVMSSTNGPGLPGADAEVRRVLLQTARAKARTPDEALELGLAFSSLIASEEGRNRTDERREMMKLAQERGFYPPGPKRQMAAIIDTGNLRPVARRITAPTMVIHGADDPLIPFACGEDIAAHVKNARFELVAGMGHDLPPSKLPAMVNLIADHCRAA
ncbi:alpha/beta fold hydrolase [Sphingorhabdus sp. 109]|jgi:pimeloyl-ACP methyl ester carboxylesterase|uniref:alpha/beta fold hydrolase n=1 Tax=Sphingorhabdus sp. 109 TaxID=2653173 RepID=UPI0012F05CAB|nr:alpha/beta hydrolase [Sphingorhabdus sp. 109]VWX60472.1 Aclacinomycin methylesterase RdmC [Sphingorhabdus sp. 109]